MSNNYLMHYRTKGSKNGERLYQYEDGRWTPLGLERRRSEYSESTGRKVAKGVVTGIGATAAIGGTAAGVYAATRGKNNLATAFTKGKDDKPSPMEKITRSSNDIMSATKDVNRAIDGKKKKPYTNDLSNEQLSRMIKRLQLEKSYSDLSSESVNNGKEWVVPALSAMGTLAASAASITTAIYLIYRAKNGGGVV